MGHITRTRDGGGVVLIFLPLPPKLARVDVPDDDAVLADIKQSVCFLVDAHQVQRIVPRMIWRAADMMVEVVDVDTEEAASVNHGARNLVLHPPAIPRIRPKQHTYG